MEDARPDAELLARASHQPELFGVLFDRHFAAVYRYLERRAGREAADDLAGEVFRLAFECRARFRPVHDCALPWLLGDGQVRGGGDEHSMTDVMKQLREVMPPAAGPELELARRLRRELVAQIADATAGRRSVRRRPLRIAIPALAAAAALVLSFTLIGRGSDVAWAAAALRVAEAAPRLLLREPGWLSALPESVVKPSGRAQVVQDMLARIPLPPGFDVSSLEAGDTVRGRYRLGAQVAGAVACAWIERRLAARASGDEGAARAAVDAMATSRTWPVLLELDSEGDYPEVLWEYADAMAGAPVPAGRARVSVEESYSAALGCDAP
jgi:hypothetical protein